MNKRRERERGRRWHRRQLLVKCLGSVAGAAFLQVSLQSVSQQAGCSWLPSIMLPIPGEEEKGKERQTSPFSAYSLPLGFVDGTMGQGTVARCG